MIAIRQYPYIMPTVKDLREQAKSYGLKGYSTLRKLDLIHLITEARAKVRRERITRAVERGRYPLLRGDQADPQRLEQQRRLINGLDAEVTATLRARKYEQDAKRNPQLRLAPRHKAIARVRLQNRARQLLAPLHRRGEPPARIIAREGERILQELIPRDDEARGRRTITWKYFRNLADPIVERIMPKVLSSSSSLKAIELLPSAVSAISWMATRRTNTRARGCQLGSIA